MLKHTRNTNNSEIRFYKKIYNEQHCTKTANMLNTTNCLQNHIKNSKETKFFYSQPSTLPKETPAKFYLSTTFGSSFMISAIAPIRSSTSYAYLMIKIGNGNLNEFI